jgi:hypothetical protein
MKYKLLDRYYLEQEEDRVSWLRIFPEQQRLMGGSGVYRDDVLVLLFPTRIDEITNAKAIREELGMDELPEWDKTRYLIHMGNVNQGYPVQEAIRTHDGTELEREELLSLVDRIEDVFP